MEIFLQHTVIASTYPSWFQLNQIQHNTVYLGVQILTGTSLPDTYHGYVPLVVDTYRSFRHSWLITWFVARLTRRMPLVEHTSGAGIAHPPEHLNSSPVFSAVRVTQSLVLYVCFVDHCFTLCPFRHCVVYLSLIYRFWLPLRYLQTLLADTWMFCQLLNLVAKCTCSWNVEPDIKETFN